MNAASVVEICAAALVTGFSKTGLPGVGILIPTLAAMAMPARASTGFILPVLIEGDCVAVGYWRRKAEWRSLARVLPWTALGIVAGYFLMGALSDAIFKPLLGGMILVIVALDLARKAAKMELRAESHVLAAAIGIIAGAFTMIANAAAPVMTIYLLSMKLPKEGIRRDRCLVLLHRQSVQTAVQHRVGPRDVVHSGDKSRAPAPRPRRQPGRRSRHEEASSKSVQRHRRSAGVRRRDKAVLLSLSVWAIGKSRRS